jgi:myosin-light-chain kinase
LSKEGHRIKIIDFGLARRFDPNKTLKVLFGTPG